MIHTILSDALGTLPTPPTLLVGEPQSLNQQLSDSAALTHCLIASEQIQTTEHLNRQEVFSTVYKVRLELLTHEAEDGLDVAATVRLERAAQMAELSRRLVATLMRDARLEGVDSISAPPAMRYKFAAYDVGADGVQVDLTIKLKEHYFYCG